MNRLVRNLADSFHEVQKRIRKLAEDLDEDDELTSDLRISPWVELNGINRLIEVLISCTQQDDEEEEIFRESEENKFGSPDELEAIYRPATRNPQPKHPREVSESSAPTKVRDVRKAKKKSRKRRSPFYVKRKPRIATYTSYHPHLKQLAVRLLAEGNTAMEVSNSLGVPVKNIRRWSTHGVWRKAGAGRKRIDPEMEEKLYTWLQQNYKEGDTVNKETLREQALLLTSKSVFMASKGWLVKFVKRYSVDELYVLM